MRTVWKYELEPEHVQVLTLPVGAQILHVGVQGDGAYSVFRKICLWAAVDTGEIRLEDRKIMIVGTGMHEIPDTGAWHLGTVLTDGGSFVWHVFELTGNERTLLSDAAFFRD